METHLLSRIIVHVDFLPGVIRFVRFIIDWELVRTLAGNILREIPLEMRWGQILVGPCSAKPLISTLVYLEQVLGLLGATVTLGTIFGNLGVEFYIHFRATLYWDKSFLFIGRSIILADNFLAYFSYIHKISFLYKKLAVLYQWVFHIFVYFIESNPVPLETFEVYRQKFWHVHKILHFFGFAVSRALRTKPTILIAHYLILDMILDYGMQVIQMVFIFMIHF